jgi:cathepsin L
MKFKKLYQTSYATVKEEAERFIIFAENFLHVQRHNAAFSNGEASFEMTINKFADRTPAEMKSLRGFRAPMRLQSNGQKSPHRKTGSFFMRPATTQYLPTQVDWRTLGAVTPVKDQGQCGSCWAFSTTGALEGHSYRKTKKLVSLSEQQLVDCAGGVYENMGCDGGLMDNAFRYIKDNGGIDTEVSYPYESGRTHRAGKSCRFRNDSVGATDTGFVDVPEGDEEALQEAVANLGPVSVAIDASSPSFSMYHKGVYTDTSCKNGRDELDHGVLVVGYGVEQGVPYWLVKNSWNSNWGEQGYIKMRRNHKNMCGIATAASYPLV